MQLLVAAKSGWGKSWMCQRLIEENIRGPYEHVLVLDYKDEYRGLVSKRHGPHLAKYWKAGERELQAFRPEHYAELLRSNGHLVLARQSGITKDEWQEIAAAAVRGCRDYLDAPTLVVIDEAHFVAPQRGTVPEAIEGLATTGRGEQTSGMYVSQRLAKVDEDLLTQCDARFLGGFGGDSDIGKVEDNVEYPVDLHKAGGKGVPVEQVEPLGDLYEPARADGDLYPGLRKFTDGEGEDAPTIGSEWIYSDDDGNVRFRDSREMSMETEHVGSEGVPIVGV